MPFISESKTNKVAEEAIRFAKDIAHSNLWVVKTFC